MSPWPWACSSCCRARRGCSRTWFAGLLSRSQTDCIRSGSAAFCHRESPYVKLAGCMHRELARSLLHRLLLLPCWLQRQDISSVQARTESQEVPKARRLAFRSRCSGHFLSLCRMVFCQALHGYHRVTICTLLRRFICLRKKACARTTAILVLLGGLPPGHTLGSRQSGSMESGQVSAGGTCLVQSWQIVVVQKMLFVHIAGRCSPCLRLIRCLLL